MYNPELINLYISYIREDYFIWTNILTYIIIFIGIYLISLIFSLFFPKKGRRAIGILLFIVLGYYIVSGYIVEVNRYDIDMGIDKPLKIVQLTDFHLNTSCSYDINSAIKKCNAEFPDIVVITGDFKTDLDQKDLTRENFKKLRQIHCEKIYVIWGNHDRFHNSKHMHERFDECGMTVLEDRLVKLQKNFYIYGTSYSGIDPKHLNKALTRLPKGSKSLILTHSASPVFLPKFKKEKLKGKKVLFLTGHTHGGQIVFPWTNKKKFAEDRFYIDTLNGMTSIEGEKVYISKGIGTTYGPFRLGVKPEITVFNIK